MFQLSTRLKPMMLYIYVTIFVGISGIAATEPLHEAAKAGDLAGVKSLIAEGCDVNVRDKFGFTPLHFVAYMGHKEVAELLILKGAHVNAVDNEKITSLHMAAHFKKVSLYKIQIANKAIILEGK